MMHLFEGKEILSFLTFDVADQIVGHRFSSTELRNKASLACISTTLIRNRLGRHNAPPKSGHLYFSSASTHRRIRILFRTADKY